MDANEYLDQVQVLLDSATPDPWRVDSTWFVTGRHDACVAHCRSDNAAADVVFIAASRQNITRMLQFARLALPALQQADKFDGKVGSANLMHAREALKVLGD